MEFTSNFKVILGKGEFEKNISCTINFEGRFTPYMTVSLILISINAIVKLNLKSARNQFFRMIGTEWHTDPTYMISLL